MMVSNRGSVLGLIAWQWKHVVFFILSAALVVVAHEGLPQQPTLPTVPLAVFGAALSIFVSFRTNQAYARWWEARQLWGKIVNYTRHFSSQVLAYTKVDHPTKVALLRRQIAYAHALRCNLRDQDLFADKDFLAFVSPEDQAALRAERNVPASILHGQMTKLTALADSGMLDARRMQSLDQSLFGLMDAQGGCERIKRTPMPKGYGFIAERLLLAYSCMFPLCIVADLHWWAIPANVVVCLSFALISEAGRVLEDPFTLFYNGLPLAALSKTLEINLRQRLGETDLPENPKPGANGILM